jgi:hypothetical protein
MYKKISELSIENLHTIKMRDCATLRDWHIVKAARLSLANDNKPYYVEVTYANVFTSETEPKFGNWYKVTGLTVEKYIPAFYSKTLDTCVTIPE